MEYIIEVKYCYRKSMCICLKADALDHVDGSEDCRMVVMLEELTQTISPGFNWMGLCLAL